MLPPACPGNGGNPVGLVEKVSRVLAENITARNNWDEPAQLYWLELSAGKVALQLFPIDQSVFDMGHRPTDVLAGLAREVAAQQDALRRAVPSGLIGLAFFCEAWAVTVAANAAEWDAAARAAAAGAVPQHPDRVEQRMIYAVERGGRRFLVSQNRGEPVETSVEHPDDPAGPRNFGPAADALGAFLSAMLGVDLRRRR